MIALRMYDTTPAQLWRLITHSQKSKAPSEEPSPSANSGLGLMYQQDTDRVLDSLAIHPDRSK